MDAINVRNYDLADAYLFDNKVITPSSVIWIPKQTCIVLGKSNSPKKSIKTANIIRNNIPVYKRPSGGETVLLSNKMIGISVVIKQSKFKSGKSYFEYFNLKIIDALKQLGVENLACKGISDIAINDVKILGSAIYQNKFIVFYHAILNVGESVDLIEKYIKHPIREPDYRKNRNHLEFVTSLENEKYHQNIDIVKSAIIKEFDNIDYK